MSGVIGFISRGSINVGIQKGIDPKLGRVFSYMNAASSTSTATFFVRWYRSRIRTSLLIWLLLVFLSAKPVQVKNRCTIGARGKETKARGVSATASA